MWPASSWLLRLWRGEVGFGKSFWIFFFAVFFAPLVAALVVINFVPTTDLGKARVVLLTVSVAFVIVPTVGFWRSGNGHKWKWVGRVFIFMWLWGLFAYVTGIRSLDDAIVYAQLLFD